jgi:hypothetical protein
LLEERAVAADLSREVYVELIQRKERELGNTICSLARRYVSPIFCTGKRVIRGSNDRARGAVQIALKIS